MLALYCSCNCPRNVSELLVCTHRTTSLRPSLLLFPASVESLIEEVLYQSLTAFLKSVCDILV